MSSNPIPSAILINIFMLHMVMTPSIIKNRSGKFVTPPSAMHSFRHRPALVASPITVSYVTFFCESHYLVHSGGIPVVGLNA